MPQDIMLHNLSFVAIENVQLHVASLTRSLNQMT